MRAYERLLRYAKIYTESDPASESHPSSANQFDLARILEGELKELGAGKTELTEQCLVYGWFEATRGGEEDETVGFIAHMDTAPDFQGKEVRPLMHENYSGEALPLGTSGRVLDPEVFPELKKLKGRTLITSDGTTLLGADDKAGIAEILTMLERLKNEDLPHGRIAVCFTPDEEVGKGTDCFDIQKFGAAYAYTVDGGEEGEVVYENFNAASAKVFFEGVNVHTGSAYGVMVNACRLAMEFLGRMPQTEVPEKTRNYEGFFHLGEMQGDVERATLSFLIRDHDRVKFEERKALLQSLAENMNEELGRPFVKVEITDSYFNMKEKIEPVFHVVERAFKATRNAGIEPITSPIRGGTDGARLSYAGLPTPNLGTGGYAFHGPFEHITAEGMDIVTEILVSVATLKD